jgi:uncharacterized protein (TIGR00303 family)
MSEIFPDVLRVYRPGIAIEFLNLIYNRQPHFILTVAYTATVQLPGVSGAGTTPELRELTATADVEILAHGKALCLPGGVPSNPNGAPGPSIITRASFDLLPDMPYLPVDAGLKIAPSVSNLYHLDGATPAQAVTTGRALNSGDNQAERLFAAGWKLGEELGQKSAADNSYLIIGESVAGGTTTALGLLLALGVDAEDKVSSSMPGNAHQLKLAAVNSGLAAIGKSKGDFATNPLAGAAALGDPMQPAVAGMTLSASRFSPVMLGGGTQMAAVIALMVALRQTPPQNYKELISQAQPENIALATTRWVSTDPTADLAGLAAEIEAKFGSFPACYLAANLNFSEAHHEGMRYYEQGFVKEGVGAGAAAIAAMLGTNLSASQLLPPIEKAYERLCLDD